LLLIALVVALLFGLFWWWNKAAKKWLEETGREEQSPSALDWLLRDVQQKPATPLTYSEQEFQEMVAKTLDEVPEEFDKEWNNVAVTVSTDWPTDADKKRMGVPEFPAAKGRKAPKSVGSLATSVSQSCLRKS